MRTLRACLTIVAFITLFFVLALVAVVSAQDPSDVNKPSWVVIFRVDHKDSNGNEPPEPIHFEMRLIVKANTEGEAALKGILHIQKYVVGATQDSVKFQEAQMQKEKK